jgi:hypothetical protein
MTDKDLPAIAYCLVDGQAVFLDLAGDRYFRLGASRNADFVAAISGLPTAPDAIGELMRAGVPFDGQTCLAREGRTSCEVRRQAADVLSGPFRLEDVAQALWLQRRIENRLARRGLKDSLAEVCRRRAGRRIGSASNEGKAARILRAFEYSRLLRSPANRCFPRSLAVATALARHGIHAEVVIGVKLEPFAAHCWVQRRDEVLNDTVEEVGKFTPILVI